MSFEDIEDVSTLLSLVVILIGIGGTVFAAISWQAKRIREGTLFKINTENDVKQLAQKIEHQEVRFNEKFEETAKRFDETDERFDKLEETIALNTKAIENSVKDAVREGNQDIVNAIKDLARLKN